MGVATANLNGSSGETSDLTLRCTGTSGFLCCKPFKGWRTLSDPVTMSSTTQKPLSQRSEWHCVVWNVHISSLVSPFPLQPPQLTFKNRAILSLLYVWKSFFKNEKWTSKSGMIFYLRISLKQKPSLFLWPLMKSLHKHASVIFGGDRGGVGKKAQGKRSELESKSEAEFYPSNVTNLILGLKLRKFGGIWKSGSVPDFAVYA